ncbi:MAG: glycoside hydrolase family 127 protein [Chthoniobacteraceae bacterium]
MKTFPLSDVRLLESPFKQAMERNAAFLLSLDADRFLHNTRKYAGLQPKGELYGGWESQGLAGHSLGHYLTALSQQFAATGDKRFRDRIDYIVSEMAECQKAYGDGYIGALPPLELATLRALKDGKVELAGGFNFKGGAWAPWYTEHKILAGLKDAWILGGSEQAKEVTLKLADWVDVVTSGLTPSQQQIMLQVEFGGMSETLVELYALTGNGRYLAASRRFYHHAVLDPMLVGRDELPGKHANTQIPKIIGEARRYEVTGETEGRKIAEFFWNRVVEDYSFAIGGNSDREHFFPPDKASEHLGPQTAETCNTYNMLKLTEHLFEWEPKVEYADFYERALYNHILASQEPMHGMFTYFISLEPGHFRTYSTETNSFWCCMGTGMENHTKYGEAIYFHGDDELYVNLFIPSELSWKEKGFTLDQETNYPEKPNTAFTIKSAPSTPISLKVRCPAWATGNLAFQLNDKPIPVEASPGQFAEIRRVWSAGDRLEVTIPMGLRTEMLHGAPDKVAFLYGPLVLAGDFGRAPESATFPNSAVQTANDHARNVDVPVLVANDTQALVQHLSREPGDALEFHTRNLAQPKDVTLRPFKDIPYDYYNVYWTVYSLEDWAKHKEQLEVENAGRLKEQARVVDELQPGEQQSEVDHGLVSDHSFTGDIRDKKWRDARDGGYFEFQMNVLAEPGQILRCTYWGDDAGARTFDILVDGKLLATQSLNHDSPGKFLDVDYPLPADLITGKGKITIRFQSRQKNTAGGLIHCAVLKALPFNTREQH